MGIVRLGYLLRAVHGPEGGHFHAFGIGDGFSIDHGSFNAEADGVRRPALVGEVLNHICVIWRGGGGGEYNGAVSAGGCIPNAL